jgi:hypothetical protein
MKVAKTHNLSNDLPGSFRLPGIDLLSTRRQTALVAV